MEQTMTESDYELYNFLVEYITENLYVPSYREIADGLGKTVSDILKRLRRLESLGKIQIKPRTSRAIKLVGYELVKKI